MMQKHVSENKKAVFNDSRGSHVKFFGQTSESLKVEGFSLKEVFMTVNRKDVLRGIHFQINPPQPKILTCVTGSARVITVCLDPSEETFGSHEVFTLTGDLNSTTGKRQVIVPAGHGLGYLILENDTRMLYMAGDDFNGAGDVGIDPFDEELALPWGDNVTGDTVILSDRDKNLSSFSDYRKGFVK